jgi:hypothetical protein
MTEATPTQRGSEQPDAIRPFPKVHFPEAELVELRRRVNGTKWPERETVPAASQGVQLATTQALARDWETDYDWRKIEAELNAVPQFITEIVLSGDDSDADIAECCGWVNRTLDDGDLDSFVEALVRRLASFDRETLAAAKAPIYRFGTPTAAGLQSSNDLSFPLLALTSAQSRRAKVRNAGYGVPSDFELNFGRYLPTFGRADDDVTVNRPGGSPPCVCEPGANVLRPPAPH